MKYFMLVTLVISTVGMLLAVGAGLAGCAPATTTLVAGDRSVTQVTAGKLTSGDGDARYFYILRDTVTGVDYLAVVDAGIVELKPKPALPVEKP